jgi:hypothetical protein
MKPWQSQFEIREAYIEKIYHLTGASDFVRRYGVFYKGTDKRPNERYYSGRKDAERGAAQIYNSIERTLLGKG